jgi:hypothetical protein
MSNEKKEEKKPTERLIDYSLTHKEIKFSDSVRLIIKEDAFLLSFNQTHPGNDNPICIAEIILPPKVAASLGSILIANALRYQQTYDRNIMPKNVEVEEKKIINESEKETQKRGG